MNMPPPQLTVFRRPRYGTIRSFPYTERLIGRLRSTSATNTNTKIQTGACAELAIVQNEIVLEVASTVFGLKMEVER